MEEDGGDDGRIGEEGEDPHLVAAGGTEQRQHVVDPREQDGPADSGRGGALTRRWTEPTRRTDYAAGCRLTDKDDTMNRPGITGDRLT